MTILLPVLFCLSLTACFAAIVPQYEEDYAPMFFSQFENNHEEQAEERVQQSALRVTEKDIKMFFFSKDTNSQEMNISNAEEVKLSNYSPLKNTVFLIHGWTNTHLSSFCTTVTNAYRAAADMNVFVVDWSPIAKQEYVQARNQVVQVGNVIGKLISDMVKNNLLKLEKTSIVGHSLGAHVAGTTGSFLQGKLDYIVGLDPAGPLFFIQVKRDRLDKSDAKFVEILHTAAGKLGFEAPLGHADYWPNGGHDQPGCTKQEDIVGSCSHSRAYVLYAESLISGKFNSWLCKDYQTFEKGGCKNGLESHFGQLNIKKHAHGNYYLNTNAESPYAKGGKH